MSEVTVLNIPLQGSLTPTVGTYVESGRTDTTFGTDTTLNESYLYSPDKNSTGYYYYYPLTIPDGVTLKIELDVNIQSNWMQAWIILFNVTTDNWWGIWKRYDVASLNVHNTIRDVYTDTRIWHHLICTFLKTSENATITLKDTNSNYSETITIPVNDSNYKDFTVTNVALLGNEFANSSCPECFIKNIRMYYELPVRTLSVHIGNEICKAYSELPEVETKGTLNWQGVENLLTISNNTGGTPITATIPLQGVANASVYFNADWYSNSADPLSKNVFSFIYDEDIQEYVLSQLKYEVDYRSPSYTIYASVADVWGINANQNTLTLEYKFKITNIKADRYNPNTPADKVCLLNFDCTSDPTDQANFSSIYLYSDGIIASTTKTSAICSTETQYASNFTLEQGVVYKVTFIATRNPIINTSYVYNTYIYTYEVYINDVLFYKGVHPVYTTIHTLEEGSFYFLFGSYYDSYLLKNVGTIRVWAGRPHDKYKQIKIKKDNTTYSLLASPGSIYPSQYAKAKIDGITYPILLKHDEDNISE